MCIAIDEEIGTANEAIVVEWVVSTTGLVRFNIVRFSSAQLRLCPAAACSSNQIAATVTVLLWFAECSCIHEVANVRNASIM